MVLFPLLIKASNSTETVVTVGDVGIQNVTPKVVLYLLQLLLIGNGPQAVNLLWILEVEFLYRRELVGMSGE